MESDFIRQPHGSTFIEVWMTHILDLYSNRSKNAFDTSTGTRWLGSRKNLAHLLKPHVWSKFSFDNLPYKSRISNSVEDRYNSEGCSSIVCWGSHQSMIITFHMKQTAFRHVLRRHKCDTQWLFQIYQFNGLALSFLVSSCSSFILNPYSIIHSKKLSGLWSFR